MKTYNAGMYYKKTFNNKQTQRLKPLNRANARVAGLYNDISILTLYIILLHNKQ